MLKCSKSMPCYKQAYSRNTSKSETFYVEKSKRRISTFDWQTYGSSSRVTNFKKEDKTK